MKKIKVNWQVFTTIIFISLIAFMFVSTLLNYKRIIDAATKPNPSGYSKNADFFIHLSSIFKNVEAQMNETNLMKSNLIDINGLFQKYIDKKVVEDVDETYVVYKMKNGQLTFNYPIYDPKHMQDAIENVTELYDNVSAQGTHLIYIQAPFKNSKYNNQLPVGIKDTTNLNVDNFLKGLKENNIPYIDLREVIEDSNMDYSSLFFNTDHHWKTETAFWTYQYILNYLNKNFGMNYDKNATDENNFKKENIYNDFLGSQANRTGKYYGGVDDFTLITPNFDTSYQATMYDGNLRKISNKSGTFEDSLIYRSHMKYPNIIRTIRDCTYLDINPPRLNITNNDVNEGKALIIEDSFGRPFSAFMSLQFKHTDILDIRYYEFESLTEYLKSNKYDYIMFIYNPSAFDKKYNNSPFTFK